MEAEETPKLERGDFESRQSLKRGTADFFWNGDETSERGEKFWLGNNTPEGG